MRIEEMIHAEKTHKKQMKLEKNMKENKTNRDLGLRILAIVYMIALTGFVAYYISRIYDEELWENERIAITLFISLAFYVTLIYFIKIEKGLIALMSMYHFILLGTVICVLLPIQYMPFMIMPIVVTAVYGKKAGFMISVTVSSVLHLGFGYYPMLVFTMIPPILCVVSCFAVWQNRKLYKNIAGIAFFILTELSCMLIFRHYCEGTGMEYENVSFIIIMLVFSVLMLGVGNVIAIVANWLIWNRVPAFYLDKISNDNYVAVKLIKNKSTSLYYHSTEVAELARLAARRIGADEQLAYTGGIYHDFGKVVGSEYIKEGLILAEKYGIPRSVKSIMVEHNVKARLPRSKEAAIVMLCDTAISAVEYLRGAMDKKDVSEKTIMENALNKRLTSGTLHTSGLSIEEFDKIKEVLIKIKEQQ